MHPLVVPAVLMLSSWGLQPPKVQIETHRCPSPTCMAFDATGARFACANQGGELLVWDRDVPKPKVVQLEKRLRESGDPIFPLSIVLDGEGRHAALFYFDGAAQVWNLSDGKKVRDLKCPCKSLYRARLSTDGRMIACKGVMKIAGRGEKSKDAIIIWNTSDWSVAAMIETEVLLNDFDFSSDSHEVLAGGAVPSDKPNEQWNGVLVAWRIDDARETGRFNYEGGHPSRIAASPDGRTVAVAGSLATPKDWNPNRPTSTAHLRLVDWKEKKILAEPFVQHWDMIRAVAFSPNGRRVYCAAASELAGGVLCLSAEEGKREWKTDFTRSNVHLMVISPDGESILASDLKSIHVLDAANGVDLGMKLEAVPRPNVPAKKKRQSRG